MDTNLTRKVPQPNVNVKNKQKPDRQEKSLQQTFVT